MCGRCRLKVAKYSASFAMSKEGIQSSYCNSAGYVHETNTVYSTIPSSVYCPGQPTDEFTWFPGYLWMLCYCSGCDKHLGWKYIAAISTMVPKWFYGLSGSSVQVETEGPPVLEVETNSDLEYNNSGLESDGFGESDD